MGKTIKSKITMQMVISLVLAIFVCFAYDGGVFPADHSRLDLDPMTRDWWKMAIAKDYKKDAGH